jgi:hypothetical protein
LKENAIRKSHLAVLQQQHLSAPDRNAKLLDIVRRSNLASFDAFIWCLKETKQRHVAKLLTADAGKHRNVHYTFTLSRIYSGSRIIRLMQSINNYMDLCRYMYL